MKKMKPEFDIGLRCGRRNEVLPGAGIELGVEVKVKGQRREAR